MWYEEAVIYQIYPLGLCDALEGWRSHPEDHKLLRLLDWIPHIKAMGADTVLLNPLFSCDYHGYDTRDFYTLDPRLGTIEDLKQVADAFHDADLRLIGDAVFNHVGRGFWAFQDVLEKREDSAYKDWFHIHFGLDNAHGDGLSYDAWEGHYNLVTLNVRNPEVADYLMGVVDHWVEQYHLDGLRLDVAYTLDRGFLEHLRAHCDERYEDFILLGEIIHGNYGDLLSDTRCHSVTNYESARGLVSALNDSNLFEIAHSLHRLFSDEPWALYRGWPLLSFADNHDINRVASTLNDPRLLPFVYHVLFTMPGVPAVYYGSEWGTLGTDEHGDEALRPAFEQPEWNDLTDDIRQLASVRRASSALCHGSFRNVLIQNKQWIFERRSAEERILVALNIDSEPQRLHFDAQAGRARDLLTGEMHDFGGGSELQPFSRAIWRIE